MAIVREEYRYYICRKLIVLMKKTTLALALLTGLCFASCDKTPNGGGDTPNPSPDTRELKNIQAVEQLLRSAGHVSEAAEDKITATLFGATAPVPAPRHTLESTGLIVDCNKVTQTVRYDFTSSSQDFSILDPWPNILWPGCLIQGNSIRGKNIPTAIPIISKRQPGRINLQITSGAQFVGHNGEGLWYEDVPEMSESNVIQAQNKLIRRWQESGIPASTSFTMEIVHSAEEAIAASGLDVNKSWKEADDFFSSAFNKKKNHILVKVSQPLYTLSYEVPDGGFKGVFKPTIEQSDLTPYTGPRNPICYISSVSYGRVYYLLFESNHTSSDLLSTLNTCFSRIKAGLEVEINQVLNESRVKMLQRGGSAYGGYITAISPAQVFKFIQDEARPDTKHAGAPISVNIKHLYDARPIRMSNTLDYSYRKTTFIPQAKNNNVSIHLRDIIVETSSKGKWEISNKGHVKILEASVSYDKIEDKGIHYKLYLYDNKNGNTVSQAGLRSTAYLPIYGRTYYDCKPEGINHVTLSVDLEIRPEAYNKRGNRSGQSKQRVTLTRSFKYDETQQHWKALSDDMGTSGNAYRTLSATRTFEDLTFNIRTNFSFFVDNSLIE